MKHITGNTAFAAARCLGLLIGVTAALAAPGAGAQTVELQQNGFLHTGSYIDNFYIDGFAGNSYTSGSLTGNSQYGPGPNLGYTFSSNATVQSSGTNAGKFENLPGGDLDANTQILSFSGLGGATTTDTINFAQGFSNVTFNYSLGTNNAAYGQTADVWSGVNGTGTLVGTIALTASVNPVACASHLDAYCSWSAASAAGLSGIGESITFGVANTAASENLELDAITVSAVPELSRFWMMLVGLSALAMLALGRRRGGY